MSRKKKKDKSDKSKKGLQSSIKRFFEKHPEDRFNYKQVSAQLKVNDSNTRTLVLNVLNNLKNEGFLNEFSRGSFVLNNDFKRSMVGVLDSTSRGAGYVIIEDKKEDVYISPENLGHALHGDTVEIEITKQRKNKTEGRITKIVSRKTELFVGTVEVKEKFAFLIPDNVKISADLYIPLDKLGGAKNGQKVLAKITSWPQGVDNPFGEVVEVLGNPGNNETEMLSILLKNDFEIKFPQKVIEEAEKVHTILDGDEIKKRRDLRETLTFTIDPFDAKDFDDALSYKELKNGNLEVGIHIADVSHYVRPGSVMDDEALKRGNSVYLTDRVIPMLPEQLSNIACSLRPNEDKFTFSAIFEMDDKGKIYDEWFGKTVIHSDRRFTYEEAQEVIEGKSEELKKEILTLDKIAKTLRKKRLNNGALSIESEELRFKLNDQGDPVEVVHKIAKDSNKLIEEFMLLANKRAAIFAGKLPGDKEHSDTNFIYRVHDKPDASKVQTFALFIDKFGYDLKIKNMDEVAHKINKLLDEIRNTPEYSLIQTMAIRSMAKASYDTNNIGHYGLAFDYYTHFTSPIRRYADLVVHRIMMDKLHKKQVNYGNKLNEVCKHISAQERKAIDAERESNKFFQVKYVQDKVGQVFEGTVSGLADFGLFVRMDENYCEGMVNIQSLPGDNYYFDNDKFRIVGRKKDNEYNFGDKVTVQIVGVDLMKKQIDLEIYEEV
ncbi:MAG: ribonuclease R [Brumimicrobium sp.]|nr:ribonuclease R [Brumimicrobium sp.]